MNRKEYVKPQMQVFNMKAEGMLCTSDTPYGGELNANRRSNFDWDDEDDY